MLPIKTLQGLAARLIAHAHRFWRISAATAILVFPILLVAVASTSHSRAADVVLSDGGVETVAIESEPGLGAFLEAYLAAQNAKDVQKIKGMYHPKDLEALAAFAAHQPAGPGQIKPPFDSTFLKAAFPQNHRRFLVQRYLKDSPLPQAGFRDWIVPPTHLVQFSYESKPDQLVTFTVHLSHLGNQWFVIDGVPSAELLRKMLGATETHPAK